MGKFNIWLCVAFTALAVWATPASADPATYTFEGYATMRIGIAGTVTGLFRMTLEADTDDIFEPFGPVGVFAVNADHAEIFIDGFGTLEIFTPMAVIADNNFGGAGGPVYADGPLQFAAMFVSFGAGWDTHDLSQDATIFDPTPLNQGPAITGGLPLDTSYPGDLTFEGRISDLTYTADVRQVPEPASMALFAIGGGLVYWRRKRQRA